MTQDITTTNAVTDAAGAAPARSHARLTMVTTADIVPAQPGIASTARMLGTDDAAARMVEAMKTGPVSKFDNQLAALYLAQDPNARSMAAYVGGIPQSAFAFTPDKRYVLIDTTAADGNGAALLRQLEALGMRNGSSFGAVASGLIPVSQIQALAGTANLRFARQSLMVTSAAPVLSTGSVTSQTGKAERADIARAQYGVDGSGLRIGVLSDSMNTSTSFDPSGKSDTLFTNIASGDLPTDTRILQDFGPGSDEGRAMAQLIHDIAPGAAIDFATAFYGEAGFANNILKLAANGSRVIVDDVRYLSEPYFQNGVISQAVNQVADQGVSYFSSAGNYGTYGYGAAFKAGDSKVLVKGQDAYTLMEFAPGVSRIQVTSDTLVTLFWDSPAASASGFGSKNDLDLFVVDEKGTVLASSTTNNIGQDPFEYISTPVNRGENTDRKLFLLVGVKAGSANPGQIKMIAYNGSFQPLASNTDRGTMLGHAAARGAMGIGAVNFSKTPEFGYTPPTAEYFTSLGGVTRLFDDRGNRLAAPEYGTVAFSAADGGNTTFFGGDSDALGVDQDPDAYGNFSGTSASAPDAAAAALLLLSANKALTPEDIRALLSNSAIDITLVEAPTLSVGGTGVGIGFDDRTGAGLIQTDKAVGFAKTGIIANDLLAKLTGTHLADTINGGALDNVIDARDGDDIVNAGEGNDTVYGGTGNDVIRGQFGDDQLFGDAGSDQLFGGAGNDILSGGDGDDRLQGGPGDDILNGGTGLDVVVYEDATRGVLVELDPNASGIGYATGGGGNDTLRNIRGVIGSDHADLLFGDGQDNLLVGGKGTDGLYGEDGDDTLNPGSGGAGYEEITVDQPDITKAASTDISTRKQALVINTAGDTAFDLRYDGDIVRSTLIPHATVNATSMKDIRDWYAIDVQAGSEISLDIDNNRYLNGDIFYSGIELFDASGRNVASNGGDKFDPGDNAGGSFLSYTSAEGGRYYVRISDAANRPNGFGYQAKVSYTLNISLDTATVVKSGQTAPVSQVADGGLGNDTVTFADAVAGVSVNLSRQGVAQDAGAAGSLLLSSIENVTGSGFDDLIVGDVGANVLIGGDGNDTLRGGEGNDNLDGGAGDDILSGGLGQDRMTGGAGADIFRFFNGDGSSASAADIITDFQKGIDTLDLTGLRTGKADKFAINASGANTFVNVDLGGNGSIDLRIEVSGAKSIGTGDILWSDPTATGGGSASAGGRSLIGQAMLV